MNEMTMQDIYRFMDAIEQGTVTLADAFSISENLDPLLMYFLLKYLREKYPAEREGPSARLLEFLSTYPSIARLASPPKDEPMVEWFDDSYSVRSFKTRENFVEAIVDKLEG